MGSGTSRLLANQATIARRDSNACVLAFTACGTGERIPFFRYSQARSTSAIAGKMPNRSARADCPIFHQASEADNTAI